MIYYVNAKVTKTGDGSKKNPFKTISEAAEIAVPGDEVIVAPGIYREYVNPKNGGTEDKRIIYRSEKINKAVISGAEEVKDWTKYKGNVWVTRIPNKIFGKYNPYTTVIKGDWFHSVTPAHTGEVYLNDKSLYEVNSIEEVENPKIYEASWNPSFTKYVWYAKQEKSETVIYANFQGKNPCKENVEINVRRNCFYPSEEGRGFITLSGFNVTKAATTWAPPTAYQEGMIGPHWSKGWIIEDCEVSHSKCSGISLGKYLQPENENKWMTKYLKDGTQTERDAICQAQREGWTKENIGSHTVRRCNIHDCGQTGIVGHLGGVFSVIEDNHIHHINNKHNLAGAEIGGIKMHAAIDVVYRRNHIHHCTRGLWLDWQAQGTRVTQNVFHDNFPPKGCKPEDGLAVGEDIFVEVSHGPTLIDNNLLLSACSLRLSTQGVCVIHNLLGGALSWVGNGTDNGGRKIPTPRYTPYHVPHRTEIAGFMTIQHGDVRFYNNIFVQQNREDMKTQIRKYNMWGLNRCNLIAGTKPYDNYPTGEEYFSRFNEQSADDYMGKDIYYDHMPIYTDGNVFCNGALPCDTEENYTVIEKTVELEYKCSGNSFVLYTDIYDMLPAKKCRIYKTKDIPMAFEPEQLFESADGKPIVFDEDMLGAKRSGKVLPGPFTQALEEIEL